MIKAVIFDLSGVMFSRINGIGKILEPLLNMRDDEIHRRLKTEEFKEFLKGKLSEDEYWSRIVKMNNWKIDVLTLKKLSRESFREIHGTKETIIKLKKNGTKLGLLSAHTAEWVCFLRNKFNYEKYFDCVLYSFQTGCTKDDKRLYEDIVKNMQVKPEYCVYIDDKEKFLKPAMEIGMKTILFKSSEQLEENPLLVNLLKD